jgi:TPR repeat protein
LCYELGEGITKDLEKAVHFAKLAAEQNYSSAIYNLVVYHMYGRGVDHDPRKALEYCQRSAAQGDLDSMFILGDMYLRGYVVKSDPIKGFNLFLAAAQHNHKLSQAYAGECLGLGVGVEADVIEAVRYLRRARIIKEGECAKDHQRSCEVATSLIERFKDRYSQQVRVSKYLLNKKRVPAISIQ